MTRLNTDSRLTPAALDQYPQDLRRQSTTPVGFWVGSNDGASIVKVEPLD